MARSVQPDPKPRDRPQAAPRSRSTGRDPRAARIVQAWRALTTPDGARRIGPGERTLVACSGGADSSALLLALAGASRKLVVGHVVHDLRGREETLADRDAARALAERLGLPFAEAEVTVRDTPGNPEAMAREARYAALAAMAIERGCRFVATGHHAEDQLESMLMAMLRGAGPRGLAGVSVKRRQRIDSAESDPGVEVIRPMLGDGAGRVPASTRADAEAICGAAEWVWRVDSSNADTRLLRNALRKDVLPVLESLRPGASVRAARGAALLGDAARVVRRRAGWMWGRREVIAADAAAWPREALRREPAIVLGELLRLAVVRLEGVAPASVPASVGHDTLSRRALAPVVGAMRDASTDPRAFRVGPLHVRVTSRQVRVERLEVTGE